MESSRETVMKTLEFRSPERVPIQLWSLKWADIYHGDALQRIQDRYTFDIESANDHLHQQPSTKGDPQEEGEYIDPWGAKFLNRQRGVIGEVKEPLVTGENWEDADKIHIPEELLTIDVEKINADCRQSSKFILGRECPRPFEQLQFLRGTEALYIDLMERPQGFLNFLEKMHDFHCRWVEAWAKTAVDGIMMMDDWGSQKSLLINPRIWRELFKPLYKDYIAIAKRYNKKTFMHSDGYTLAILPDLIEIGLDAINAQIFCIGLDKLVPFKGKITFWGEIDRQYLLTNGTVDEVNQAVHSVYNTLWQNGGCIGQCEFGAGARPENVEAVFETWSSFKGE